MLHQPVLIGLLWLAGYHAAMTRHLLFGFHAVGVRLKTAPGSVVEVHVDSGRRDQRMRQLIARAEAAEVRLVDSDDKRLRGLAGNDRHQGVLAIVEAPVVRSRSLDDTLEAAEASGEPALVLVLDGVTDPHNLGACLRVADGAGAHAVIAPKDHAVGISATVSKVASGAAESVPYFMVTQSRASARRAEGQRDIRVVGTAEDAPRSIYELDLSEPGGDRLRRRGWRPAAPAHRAHLRRARPPADEGRGREPERLGRKRHLPGTRRHGSAWRAISALARPAANGTRERRLRSD